MVTRGGGLNSHTHANSLTHLHTPTHTYAHMHTHGHKHIKKHCKNPLSQIAMIVKRN
jgi:hypothetical protein